jgi:tetratricopeptide (TPR) repeat protein
MNEAQDHNRPVDVASVAARLDGCGADEELLRLTKAYLCPEAVDRPKDVREVADALRRYLDGVQERLCQAEVKAVEEVKRRRRTLALAATVLLAMALGGGSALWYQRQAAVQREEAARREAELRAAVRAGVDKVADLRQRTQWGEAWAALEQVRQRLGPSGPEDLRRQVEEAEEDLTLLDRLDAARLKASVGVGSPFDSAWAAREYAAAFREAGLGDETGPAVVTAQQIRWSAVREQLVAAVDEEWAWQVGTEERQVWLLAVAQLVDPDSWCDRFRHPAVLKDRVVLERLAGEAKVSELSPPILAALGALLDRSVADAVPLLTAAQRQYPSDFWLSFTLAQLLGKARRWDEAIGYYRAALALRPTAMPAYHNLAIALRSKGRVNEAIAELQKAIEIARLDGKEKARLRNQALDWLGAELAQRTKQLESGQPAERTAAQEALRHWQKDSALAGLRDAAALTKLPPEERTAWTKLWADVAALVKKAGEERKQPPTRRRCTPVVRWHRRGHGDAIAPIALPRRCPQPPPPPPPATPVPSSPATRTCLWTRSSGCCAPASTPRP